MQRVYMPQYNFYIDEKLKERVEKALVDSGISGKPKFLDDMVRVYQAYLTSKSDIEIDMNSYQNTNQESKDVIQKAFTHILTTLDYNFSTLQQEKIYIEKQKHELNTQKEDVEQQVQKIKLKAYEDIKELNSKYELEKETFIQENKQLLEENIQIKELLQKSKEELNYMTSIAKQTNSIIEENRELKANIIEAEKRYSNKFDVLQDSYNKLQKTINKKEQELFEIRYSFTRCKEELKKYQIKVDNKDKELDDMKSKYNQLLGKVEILERLEKEYHEMDDRRRANKNS